MQGTTAPVVYQYNAFGERVSKNSGSQTLFSYDEDGHLLGEYASNGDLIAETIWLGDTPIATIRPNSEPHNGLIGGSVKVFFIQPDHLDTPRTIVDNNNQVIWQWYSDPFGKALPNQDIDGDSVDFVFNLRFPGQYFDVETGTHYNYFRDYEAETGRYLQSDPIGLDGGLNTYSYAGNDTLWYIDEFGLAVRRPPWRPTTDETLRERSRGACEVCGRKGKKLNSKNPHRSDMGGLDRHHVSGHEWAADIRDPIQKSCLPDSVKRKMMIDQFNDTEFLLIVCKPCHLNLHGKK